MAFQAGFFYFDGFANIRLQHRFHLRDFADGGELDPACGLRMLTGAGENAMDIVEQRAFEEGECAGVF